MLPQLMHQGCGVFALEFSPWRPAYAFSWKIPQIRPSKVLVRGLKRFSSGACQGCVSGQLSKCLVVFARVTRADTPAVSTGGHGAADHLGLRASAAGSGARLA